ncbi:MAG: hypothetical protein ACOY3M_04495 [Patescibacteria group bacterium]
MISILIICQKIDDYLIRTIKSVLPLNPQIIVDISQNGYEPLGARKNHLLRLAAYEWVLLLDTDEIVTDDLLIDIRRIISNPNILISGYAIRYQNHVGDKPLLYGGEVYKKVRLFKKIKASVSELPIHEEISVNGDIGVCRGKILHYSYRSITYVLLKFTKYAWQMAGEKKKAGERVTLKKLFLYGPHMVWARAIKDEGWRDGWRGILIALCFGYMESLMYWLLLWRNIFG